MISYMFTKLLPKDVSFVAGETPSPDKLNGIFNQISSAFTFVESFLGNGTDYAVSNNSDRKMLFNLSTAIGKTDKLYQPKNRVPDLKRIFKKYSIDNYITYNDTAKSISITNEIVIPAEIKPTDLIGIYYKGKGAIQINGQQRVFTDYASGFNWYYMNVSELTTDEASYFYLWPVSGHTFEVKAMYISSEAYNTGYSVSLSNDNFYTVKVPCKWADPSASPKRCVSKSCNYCIGNTYSYDNTNLAVYGTPTCSGALDNNGASISYQAEVGTTRAGYLTLQSPINTTENIYSIKYRPFYMHQNTVDTEVTNNMCAIYDTKDQVEPIKYKKKLYSAGRGDIFYIKDNTNILTGDNKRYIVIGGNYGLVDLLYDMMDFMQRPLPTNVEVLGPAVYEV